MNKRCYDTNNHSYSWYGEKGIVVCEEWRDYSNFKQWAIASGYNEEAPRNDCTIDRINPNGDYCPENCRWVNMKQQENNRSNNRILTYQGESKTMKQWSEEFGIKYTTLFERLSRGWSVEEALNIPTKGKQRKRGISNEE